MAQSQQHTATLTLGLFLLILLAAIVVAMGFSMGILVFLVIVVGFIFAFRYTYATMYLGMALAPFQGIMVSIPAGSLSIGERAFGGSIDVSLTEVVMLFVIAAWAIKLILFWYKRRDTQWLPRLPIVASYLSLFVAHVVSLFSPFAPDPLIVLKYSFRPILLSYVAYVAVPVNLIRSRRRLVSALLIMSAVGTFVAANGLYAMFFDHPAGALIGRAHPSLIFGVNALGTNQNELADILVCTVFFTLAASLLVKEERVRRLLLGAAVLQFVIGLLTFTRTIWIMFIVQGLFLYWMFWRDAVKKHLRILSVVALLLLPVAIGMISYAGSDAASSSNTTRVMLIEIAWNIFQSSPWLGAGAGTFVDHVGATYVFRMEFGDPLDAHGFPQKIMAEAGTLGLLALGFVYIQLLQYWYAGWKQITGEKTRYAYALIVMGAVGVLGYQVFNTDYWNAKMWLPVGIALAATFVLKDPPRDILEP